MTTKQYFQYLTMVALWCVILVLLKWNPTMQIRPSTDYWKVQNLDGSTLVEICDSDRAWLNFYKELDERLDKRMAAKK